MTRDSTSSATPPLKHSAKAVPAAAMQARAAATASSNVRGPIIPRRSSPLRNRRSPQRNSVSPRRRELTTRPHVPRLSANVGTARLSTSTRPISRSFAAKGGSSGGETPRRIFGAGGMLTATTSALQKPWSTPSPRLGDPNPPGTRIAAMAANARAKPVGVSGGARTSVRMRSPVRLASGTSSSMSSFASSGSSFTSRR
eukprot:COSAG01_NODE_24324_length_783_cov_0.893275_1_plen_199_part_00